MAVTTGALQDLVQLSQDTLYHLGPAFSVGNAAASTVTHGMSNSAGALLLTWAGTNNQTLGFATGNGALLTGVNVSGGTTSNNLSAITFANGNNATFGLNASTLTVSAPVNFSAGTTSNNLTQLSFSNGSGVSWGLNGGTLTASINALTNVNLSAGTTSNNLTAVTFSNANGISFGLNASVVTAVLGGMSSWSNGRFATALSMGQNTLFFQPVVIPYAMTVTNLMWLASVSNVATNSSGGVSVSMAIYSLSAGTKITLASSGSTNLTWTSGAALSSNTGINYQQMSVNSWLVTPGAWLLAYWFSTQNSNSMSVYGEVQQPSISSGQVAAMSNLMLPGYSQATTNALVASFGITNTASYIRTGATAAEIPTIIMQGT